MTTGKTNLPSSGDTIPTNQGASDGLKLPMPAWSEPDRPINSATGQLVEVVGKLIGRVEVFGKGVVAVLTDSATTGNLGRFLTLRPVETVL